jgi:hypothetical protein
VAEKSFESDRRATERRDRRKHSRSGRRANDPRVNWRRLTWLFAGYAMYLSLLSLPETIRRRFRRPQGA